MPIIGSIVLTTVGAQLVVGANTRRKGLMLWTNADVGIAQDSLDAVTSSVPSTYPGIPLSFNNYTGDIWAALKAAPIKGQQITRVWFIEESFPEVPNGFIPNTIGGGPDSNNYIIEGPFFNQASGPIMSDPMLVGMRPFTLQFSSSGSLSYQVQPQGSLDGFNWYPLPCSPGSPNNGSDHPLVANITADGIYAFTDVMVNQMRLNLISSMTSGKSLSALLSCQ